MRPRRPSHHLMMGTETISETLDTESVFKHPIGREKFTVHSHRESFGSNYMSSNRRNITCCHRNTKGSTFKHLNDYKTRMQIKRLSRTRASLNIRHFVMFTECVSGNLKMQFVNLLCRFWATVA